MKGTELATLIKSQPRGQGWMDAVLDAEASWIDWPRLRVPFGNGRGAIFVAADVFAVGEGVFGAPADILRMPLDPLTAQRICDRRGTMMPTQKICDLIAKAAEVRLAPMPGTRWKEHHPGWGGDSTTGGGQAMLSGLWVEQHNAIIEEQLVGVDHAGKLVIGTKKDIMLSNRLEAVDEAGHGGPFKVCIGGWYQLNGVPIQPLSTIHENTYWDYSHGLREVWLEAELDGQLVQLVDLLKDPATAGMLSYEGVLRVLRQPNPVAKPKPAAPAKPAAAVGGAVGSRVIKLGSTGADVGAWQRVIGISPTTDYFGTVTDAATRKWQTDHNLNADGEVGPKSWAASTVAAPSAPVNVTPETHTPQHSGNTGPQFDGVVYLQARNYTHAAAGRTVLWIVLHSMEIAEKGDTAEACARMFSTTDRLASSHLCIDADSAVQCVMLNDVAFAAPGANRAGVQLEHAGYARQSAAEWGDAYSAAMLERSAGLAAQICAKFGLPITFVDAEGLLRGEPGITTHYEATLAGQLARKRGLTSSAFYAAKTDHTDPGPQFPMAAYLEKVRAA